MRVPLFPPILSLSLSLSLFLTHFLFLSFILSSVLFILSNNEVEGFLVQEQGAEDQSINELMNSKQLIRFRLMRDN